MKGDYRRGRKCAIDGCGRALSSGGLCWAHRKQQQERQARELLASIRMPADSPDRQPFQVVTTCSLCGEIDVTVMPPAVPPSRDAVRDAALLVWPALHGTDCPGAVDVAIYAADAASSWTFAGEAPFIRGTIRPGP